MQVNTIIEQLLFVTVRIVSQYPDGSEGRGTGFVLSKAGVDGRVSLLLVTNRHVVEGASIVLLYFVAATESDQPDLGVERSVAIPASLFKFHDDPGIDIAMVGMAGIGEHFLEAGTPIFFKSVSIDMCATNESLDDFEPIEAVTFVGYPNGLYDSFSLLPIVRQGYSATALTVDYEGKPTFLIDASVFPGSSGSPVFLIPKPSAPDKYGNITIGSSRPPIFLGVVAAVHQRQIPVLQTSVTPGVPFVNELLDLGIVYKASEVARLAGQMISSSSER